MGRFLGLVGECCYAVGKVWPPDLVGCDGHGEDACVAYAYVHRTLAAPLHLGFSIMSSSFPALKALSTVILSL